MSRLFSLSAWFAALALTALSMTPASAQVEGLSMPPEGYGSVDCYGHRGLGGCSFSYRAGRVNPHVINVRASQTDEERAAAAERDRRWTARCRPIVEQDRYGMPRYRYAAPGCEFGRLD